LFGWHIFPNTQAGLDLQQTFDVALHGGTFIAIVALMWREVVHLLKAVFGSIGRRTIRTRDEKIAWLLVISTIPAGLVGVAFEKTIEDKLGRPWLIAVMLIAFGVIIWAVDKAMARTRESAQMKWYEALFVGVAQAVALIPGVSRSGVTMTGLRGLKLTRSEAVRYSFLLSIPVTGGAALYKGVKVAAGKGLPAGTVSPFVIGIATAAVSGFIAAWFLLRYIKTHSFAPFAWYRFALGALVLILIATGVR
jgi:undecaprenyl-diphosphatase